MDAPGGIHIESFWVEVASDSAQWSATPPEEGTLVSVDDDVGGRLEVLVLVSGRAVALGNVPRRIERHVRARMRGGGNVLPGIWNAHVGRLTRPAGRGTLAVRIDYAVHPMGEGEHVPAVEA